MLGSKKQRHVTNKIIFIKKYQSEYWCDWTALYTFKIIHMKYLEWSKISI